MVDLNMKVFENFTFKEIIGDVPPLGSEMKIKLENKFSILTKNLENKNQQLPNQPQVASKTKTATY